MVYKQKYPTILLVGRSNVGKSALFNALCSKRISIVDGAIGVTRDVIEEEFEGFRHRMIVKDAAGIESRKEDPFSEICNAKTLSVVSDSDLLLFVVDGHSGLQENEIQLARNFHRLNIPMILVINKLDRLTETSKVLVMEEFTPLAIKTTVCVSAVHRLNIGDLVEEIEKNFSQQVEVKSEETEEKPSFKIAVAGQPNVGKSSLLNQLLGFERSLVSPIAGTTRDAVSSFYNIDDICCSITDTAGLKKKKQSESLLTIFLVFERWMQSKKAILYYCLSMRKKVVVNGRDG